VQLQYAGGAHKIASWATITNAQIFPGPAIIPALKTAAQSAISAQSSKVATEIYGGDGQSRELPIRGGPPEREAEDNSGDEDEDEDDADDNEDEKESEEEAESEESDSEERRASRDRAIPPPNAGRKASEVSISTTISSTAEYVSASLGFSSTEQGVSTVAGSDRPPVARGLLLLAQMSSADNMFTPPYTNRCVELAREHRDFVMGFIAQEALNRDKDDNFIVMTPGVNLPAKSEATQSTSSRLQHQTGSPSSTGKKQAGASTTSKGDALGQQYNDPRSLILEKGVDVIIVGRGILNADDSEEEAERYRKEGWRAIVERCNQKKS